VVQTYQTDEFGVPTVTQGAGGQPFQYTGEQRDGESGFVYLRARVYNPATGPFLSRDSLDGDEDNPLSLHRYTYVMGNPMKLVDPSGHKSVVLAAIVNPGLQRLVEWVIRVGPKGWQWLSGLFGRIAPGSPAPRSLQSGAYEIAKAGGKHAGLLGTYAGRPVPEIERALASYERQVAIHKEKLANSAGAVEN
jgi:RHS repeat-associated protein